MEHTREKPAYMHYVLLCNIMCFSLLTLYMHQKEPTKKDTHTLVLCAFQSGIKQQMDSKHGVDCRQLFHPASEKQSQHRLLLNPCPGFEVQSVLIVVL